jgi:non-homologous end joining protein Ku
VNAATGAEVKQADIVKGYAVSKDRYVILSDADLKAANPKATRTEAPEEEPEAKVLDLMAALKRSVESKGKSKAPRRSAARGKTAARRSA